MKRWLLLTFILALFSFPSTFFLVNTLESSNEVRVTALVEAPGTQSTTSGSSGGNSGGGGRPLGSDETLPEASVEEEIAAQPELQAAVYFGGYAFPDARVTFSLDGSLLLTLNADEEGAFQGSYGNLSLGEHVFTFQAYNYDGNASRTVSYAYTVLNEAPLYISSILLPPLFYPLETGEELEGLSISGSEIQVYGVSQGGEQLVPLSTIEVDEEGKYSYLLDLKDGTYEQYYVSCSFEGQACGYSAVIPVQIVGGVYEIPSNVFADFTRDIEVNFEDFSFMRAAFLSRVSILFYDLDEDGSLTLKDFSLLNYQWTQ